jgi:AcrR family transcriptional regulator
MTANARHRSGGSVSKGSQRERLIEGMIAAANHEGYAAANVAAVIEQAGVSRATFYEHFSDREQCFVAAMGEIHAALIDSLRTALAREPAELADAAVLKALVAFAGSEPARARFLMSESLAGGAATLDARDCSVKEIARALDHRRQAIAAGASAADLPRLIVIGATYRMLGSRLRRGERALAALARQMLRFIGHYERPIAEHRWASVAPSRAVATSPERRRSTLRPPPPLPPGRPRISESAVAENHRLRIMFATAELVREQGYTATTITEVTKRAGVDGRVFYRMFADKQEAFSAIHELGFQQLMAVTAGAFFAAELWPERMCKALGTLTEWLEANPAVAHVGFVESYAVGPGAVQRVEDSLIAFTIFLQEGYQHRPIDHAPTHEALEAIVTCVFETVYRELRGDEEPKISATLPALLYLSLAPFLGVGEADRFIEAQLASDAS